MALTLIDSGTYETTGSSTDVAVHTGSAGVYVVQLDLSAMRSSDTVEALVAVSSEAGSGTTAIETWTGIPEVPVVHLGPFPVLDSVDPFLAFFLRHTAGGPADIYWRLIQVA
jgi:hypothetical protein